MKAQLSNTELVIAWILGIYLGIAAAVAAAFVFWFAGMGSVLEAAVSMATHPVGATAVLVIAATGPFAVIGAFIASALSKRA